MLVYYMLLFFWFIVFLIVNDRHSPVLFEQLGEYELKCSTERKILIFFFSFSLFIIMGFRGVDVGADTRGYKYDYSIWSNVPISNIDLSISNEGGYKILQSICGQLGISWQIFLMVVTTIIVCTFADFVKKYSVSAFTPFFLYVTIGIFVMNMTGIRQSLAVAISLISFSLAREKKLVRFLLCVAIAVSIHYSALILPVLYIIVNMNFKSKRQLWFWTFLPVAVRLFGNILLAIFDILALEKYKSYGYFTDMNYNLNILAELVPIFIMLACFFILMLKDKICLRDYHFYILTSLYVCTYEMTHVVYLAGRLNFYFSPYVILLIGNLIYGMKKSKMKYLAYAVTFLASLLFFAISVPGSSYRIDEYSFFWER